MNNKKILESLDMIIEGLTTLKAELSAPVNKVESVSAEPKSEKVSASEKPETDSVDLENMKYSELKRYASMRGVKTVGTRDEIIARIKKADGETTEDQTPVKDDFINEPVKSEEPETDEFDALAKKVAEETDIKDIIGALADVNIKATKKNAIQKLADALRSGLIELDDDDEEADSEDTTDSDEEVSEDSEDDTFEIYHPEYDPEGYNDPENMTDARRETCEAMFDDIVSQVMDEKLSLDEIKDYLDTVCTEDEAELVEDSDDEVQVLSLYIEMKKRFVDDEGNICTPNDPYEIDGENFCCGHKLKYDKKSNMYICEICGQEYEAEEED